VLVALLKLSSVFTVEWSDTSHISLKFQNMGNRSSLLLREEEIAQIQEETGCKDYIILFH